MASIKELSTTDLQVIVDCNSLTELKNGPRKKKYADILANIKRATPQISLALPFIIPAAINASSLAIDIVWAITSLIELAFFNAVILTAVFAIIMLVLGSIYAYNTFRNKQRKIDNYTDQSQLSELKFAAVEELLQREKNHARKFFDVVLEQIKQWGDNTGNTATVKQIMSPYLDPNVADNLELIQKFCHDSHWQQQLQQNFKTKLHSFENVTNTQQFNQVHLNTTSSGFNAALKSLGISTTLCFTLFVSFYWGITSILTYLELFSLAAMLTGPVGIAIAGALTVLAAAYIGWKHYQANQSFIHIQNQVEKQDDQTESKFNEYQEIYAYTHWLNNTKRYFENLNELFEVVKYQTAPLFVKSSQVDLNPNVSLHLGSIPQQKRTVEGMERCRP